MNLGQGILRFWDEWEQGQELRPRALKQTGAGPLQRAGLRGSREGPEMLKMGYTSFLYRDDNCHCLLYVYYMAGTLLRTLSVLTHLFFTKTLWGTCSWYHPRFTDEKTDTQRNWLEGAELGFRPRQTHSFTTSLPLNETMHEKYLRLNEGSELSQL